MSYNNFNYFKGSTSQNQFWEPRNPNASSLELDRSYSFGSQPSRSSASTNFTRLNFSPNQLMSSSGRPEVIHGTVTQLFSSFGYINDNIIFSKTDVVGGMVQKGDAVEVYATYQPNNPTKYKGERVCKIEQLRFGSNSMTNFGKMKTLSQGITTRIGSQVNNRPESKYGNSSTGPRLGASLRNRLANKPDSSNKAVVNLAEFRRSVALKDKKANSPVKIDTNKANKGGKKKKPEPAPASVTSVVKVTTDPKKVTVINTQAVKAAEVRPSIGAMANKPVSKYYESFAYRELDCAAVKNQCQNLILPKEFFHTSLKYQQSFPLNHPMKLGNKCQFKIMDRRVNSIDDFVEEQLNSDIDPEDADTTFVAKVMLLSTDDLAKFYKDTLKLAEEFDGESKIPITNAIKFLVGSCGQDKEFGIGGAWSPSLDGADPETNPRVLINTAIRTCKAMTGIDLSHCASWPKFLELHYYRPLQEIKKPCANDGTESMVIDVDATEEPKEYREPRMETVVYYIPDVWNCMPSQDNWNEITRLYMEQMNAVMFPPPPSSAAPTITSKKHVTLSTGEQKPVSTTNGDSITEGDQIEEEDWNFETDLSPEQVVAAKTSEPEPENQATHFSKLVVATMKIVDIKKELEMRKLNNRGVMEQLKARLKAALDREEVDEKNKDAVAAAPAVVEEVALKCLLSEEEKNELKKMYVFPEQPAIIVHQNKKLFNKEMTFKVISIHSLMHHTKSLLPENTFELALFGKQFLEMLRRDAVFNIYKSIVVAKEEDLAVSAPPAKNSKSMVTTSKRTVNRPLLFSCSLLDCSKMNKISLDDLKVLIEGLGICLSSDQLSSVLGKLKQSSNYLYYRQLTDKEMSDSDIDDLMNMDVSEDLDYIKELAMGNKALFDVETTQMDTLMNDDEIERLKNELDRSERCRQTIELKVSSIKEETERNFRLTQSQTKEMIQWKERAQDYEARFEDEYEQRRHLQEQLDKMTAWFEDISRLSGRINKVAMSAIDKGNTAGDKRGAMEAGEGDVSGSVDGIMMDLTEDNDNVCAGNEVDVEEEEEKKELEEDMTVEVVNGDGKEGDEEQEDDETVTGNEKVTEMVEEDITVVKNTVQKSSAATVQLVATEDFDLSKPSDYDMITIDETE